MSLPDTANWRKEQVGMPRTDADNSVIPVLEEVRAGELPDSQLDRILSAISKLDTRLANIEAGQVTLQREVLELRAPDPPNPAPPYTTPTYAPPGFGVAVQQYAQPAYAHPAYQPYRLPQHAGRPPPPPMPTSCWYPPAHCTHQPFQPQDRHQEWTRMDPPRFDGSYTANWIFRIQYYFDRMMTPETERLHNIVMLFALPRLTGLHIIAQTMSM